MSVNLGSWIHESPIVQAKACRQWLPSGCGRLTGLVQLSGRDSSHRHSASSCHACSGLFTKRKSSLWIIACQQLEPGDLQPYDCNFVPRSCTRTSGTWPQYHTVIGWSNQPDVLVTCPRRPTFHTTRTVRDRIDRTLTVTVQRSSSDFAWSALLSYTRTAGRQRTCTSNHASCTAERARRPGLHSVLFAGFAVAGGCRSSPWHFTSNASQPAVCVRTARGHQRCAGSCSAAARAASRAAALRI